MSLNDILLINYRHSNCEPLRSITQLQKEEAFALAKKYIWKAHPVQITVLGQVLQSIMII